MSLFFIAAKTAQRDTPPRDPRGVSADDSSFTTTTVVGTTVVVTTVSTQGLRPDDSLQKQRSFYTRSTSELES